MLEQAREEGYRTVVRVGSRGLVYAREFIANAAIKGVTQIQQRSFSMDDVSNITQENDDRYVRVREGEIEKEGSTLN